MCTHSNKLTSMLIRVNHSIEKIYLTCEIVRHMPAASGWPTGHSPQAASRSSGRLCREHLSAAFVGLSMGLASVTAVDELEAGPLLRFADWPDKRAPRRAAGVYTVWRGDEFIYAGMSGRGAQREDFVAQPGQHDAAMGLWTRLNSHASGRRSGDQFNVYVCDRFVVPVLTTGQQRQIADGCLLLDQLTRTFIRDHLGYRYAIHPDGAAALAAETAVRAGCLVAGKPFLNPL